MPADDDPPEDALYGYQAQRRGMREAVLRELHLQGVRALVLFSLGRSTERCVN